MNSTLLRRYHLTLAFFIGGLVLSGLTAFPLLTELELVSKTLGIAEPSRYAELSGLRQWMAFVHHGVAQTYERFPFIGYGTDWLAFGHLTIAMFFIGPWRDPIGNRWVLKVGIVACACVVPLAFIAGEVRGIPMLWRVLDCSFGVFGAVPLLLCLKWSRAGAGAPA